MKPVSTFGVEDFPFRIRERTESERATNLEGIERSAKRSGRKLSDLRADRIDNSLVAEKVRYIAGRNSSIPVKGRVPAFLFI